jgi:alanine racemase
MSLLTTDSPHEINQPIARIHLANILHNFRIAQSLAPQSKTMAVIKADGYGHGVLAIANTLEEADNLAVARVYEAVELRQAGCTKPIVVLEGFLGLQEYKLCRQHKLVPVVHCTEQLELLVEHEVNSPQVDQQSDQTLRPIPVWIKLDSGMHRLGFDEQQLARSIVKLNQLNIIGVMSHMANADDQSHPLNQIQLNLFNSMLSNFAENTQQALANSAATMQMQASHLQWIRPGIMLYGSSGSVNGSAVSALENEQQLLPGMTLSAPVISTRQIQAGEQIGYGSIWRAEIDCRIAVVGLGYGDGYPREMPQGTPVLVNGQRRGLVGRISMDLLYVLLEPDDQVELGTHIQFWGNDLPIDEIAAHAGTIAYTLMTGLTGRVKRIYQN